MLPSVDGQRLSSDSDTAGLMPCGGGEEEEGIFKLFFGQLENILEEKVDELNSLKRHILHFGRICFVLLPI